MSEIPKKDECPVDNVMNDISRAISPTFRKLHFTPNGITTLSLIFGIFACFFLWKGKILLFSVMYFVSYFFDCMDGTFARKYGMTSKFGDYYDHGKDVVVGIAVLMILVMRYPPEEHPGIWFVCGGVMVIFTFLLGFFIGCQAKKYKKGSSTKILENLCENDTEKKIRVLRFFGTGVWTIALIIIVWIVDTAYKKSRR